MVKRAWNEFSEAFTEVIPYGEIPDVLADWDENPEEAMRQWFGYTVPDGHGVKPRSNGWGSEGIASKGSQDFGIPAYQSGTGGAGREKRPVLSLDDLDL